jgi:hypothetical protein
MGADMTFHVKHRQARGPLVAGEGRAGSPTPRFGPFHVKLLRA